MESFRDKKICLNVDSLPARDPLSEIHHTTNSGWDGYDPTRKKYTGKFAGKRETDRVCIQCCGSIKRRNRDHPKASSLALCAAFTTALMSVTRSLPSSSSIMASMVHPAGVVTASFSNAG
jgi:hypothetical protein